VCVAGQFGACQAVDVAGVGLHRGEDQRVQSRAGKVVADGIQQAGTGNARIAACRARSGSGWELSGLSDL
jgi:hypothetical protein